MKRTHIIFLTSLIKKKWINAINKELYNMKKLNVFKKAQLFPNNVNIVSCK